MRLPLRNIAILAAGSICLAAVAAPALSADEPATEVSSAASGELAIPDTPAGEVLGDWLAAFDAADRAGLAAIIARFSGASAPTVEGMLNLRERTGGFDLRRVEETDETRLVVLAQERGSDQFVRIAVELDGTPEHRILSMPVGMAVRPPEFALARLGDAALARQLGEKLDTMVAAGEFSGVVVVEKDGMPVFSGAYGLADRERQIPVRPESKFRIASMGKMFTGTAVLQLVQAGKIALSDPLSKYIPDYPNKEIAVVTIEQLLTHTGGTGDMFTPEVFDHAAELDEPVDYVNLLGERGPNFTPGSRYEYSNYGYVLLGRVIEIASGETYYDYLQQHIFDPAGMSSTGFWRESEPLEGRVIGYEPSPQGLRAAAGVVTDRASPAGGAISTAGDLLRFARALLDHTLLDAGHLEQLFTGRAPMAPNAKYALGFGDIGRGTPFHRVGHNGGAPGQNGELLIYPEAGYVAVLISNFSPPAAQRLSDFIANRVGG